MNVSQQDLSSILQQYNKGHFFTVTFVKRTTGEVRIMNCRKGVHKYVSGVGMKYDPKEKNLLGVWIANGDGGPDNYRMINLDNLISATIDGIEYIVA